MVKAINLGRGVPLSHCCGLVVAFACGVGRTFGGFGGFGGFEAWQMADLNTYKKPLPRPGGALQPLLWLLPAGVPEAWTP